MARRKKDDVGLLQSRPGLQQADEGRGSRKSVRRGGKAKARRRRVPNRTRQRSSSKLASTAKPSRRSKRQSSSTPKNVRAQNCSRTPKPAESVSTTYRPRIPTVTQIRQDRTQIQTRTRSQTPILIPHHGRRQQHRSNTSEPPRNPTPNRPANRPN